jgi:tRNA(fMet)-specific endonuclease VapC
VLDTDLLSIVQRRTGDSYERLQLRLEIASRTEPVCVTLISFEEQTRGWLTYIAKARTAPMQLDAYARLLGMLEDFCKRRVLTYDAATVARFGELRRAKIRIGTMDLKIAAIVLARGAKLLSRNLGDFRKVPGLSVEDWTLP